MLQRVVVDPAQIQPPRILLTPPQQHYLSRVLRLKAGDRFIAMNGLGHSWLVGLEDGDAQILQPITSATELLVAITLVIALPKGNAFDEVVRQATELGVGCIAPVISDRTLLNPSPQKLERWRRIAQEAAEQSERQLVPTLLDPLPFAQHLTQLQSHTQNYLCVTRRPAPHLLTLLLSTPHSPLPTSLLIAIGSEGGWTESEVEQAIAAGYHPVSLGSRILRAVTAPIFALSLMAAVYERGIVTEGEGTRSAED